jgi:hypothetical protein
LFVFLLVAASIFLIEPPSRQWRQFRPTCRRLVAIGFSPIVTQFPAPSLLFFEELLLGADHSARATDSHPSNQLVRGPAVVLHQITGIENACATQACLAMDPN